MPLHEYHQNQKMGDKDHVSALPVSESIQLHHHTSTIRSQDQYELARVGKKQVLKVCMIIRERRVSIPNFTFLIQRNFGLVSMLGFSCTLLATWEGQLIGGPAGLVYGYIIVWLGTTSVFIVLSELASIGGQYHWCYVLAPPSYRKLLSYITGWLTVAGWQAGVVSAAYLTATVLQGLVILNHDNYVYKAWHATLIIWAILLACVFINTVVSRYLPKIEGIILILHILGFFAILVPMLTLAEHNTASDIFTLFLNGGDFPTQGLSFFVGLTGTVAAFLGADGVIHMSEEVENASVTVPRAIMLGVFINGTLGFGMLSAALFCLGNVDDVLLAPYLYPFIEIFVTSTGSISGSTAMASLIVLLSFCTTIGLMASSSRMTWSFARDRGLPGWEALSKVDRKTSIPLVAVLTTTVIAALLSLISIGSTTALNDLLSLSINSWYASYLIPSMLLLKHRLRGSIHIPVEGIMAGESLSDLNWGPWRISGLLGTLNNAFACIFMIIILFFSFWPITIHVQPSTMNFSILVTGSVALLSICYYFLWSNRTFKGPVMETTTEEIY
ncbi:choline transport protein [Rutstroemia sp. NJR-2017a WRK4]|nr:choline transport protein [Rutstroemia sp. NJR-2017a WRK4]